MAGGYEQSLLASYLKRISASRISACFTQSVGMNLQLFSDCGLISDCLEISLLRYSLISLSLVHKTLVLSLSKGIFFSQIKRSTISHTKYRNLFTFGLTNINCIIDSCCRIEVVRRKSKTLPRLQSLL